VALLQSRQYLQKKLFRHMEIRKSTEADIPHIASVHMRAFGEQQGKEIARLVHELFDDPTARPILSLVACDTGQITGNVLFTKVTVVPAPLLTNARILAPLGVVPEAQGSGCGSMLVLEGLRLLQKAGVELVFVLGHPEYYPRFCFTPAGVLGFEAPYPIPPDSAAAWMVQELRPGVIGTVHGTVQCADALNRPEHWRE
jgi:predicted N-acetyltransferase YhbS